MSLCATKTAPRSLAVAFAKANPQTELGYWDDVVSHPVEDSISLPNRKLCPDLADQFFIGAVADDVAGSVIEASGESIILEDLNAVQSIFMPTADVSASQPTEDRAEDDVIAADLLAMVREVQQVLGSSVQESASRSLDSQCRTDQTLQTSR